MPIPTSLAGESLSYSGKISHLSCTIHPEVLPGGYIVWIRMQSMPLTFVSVLLSYRRTRGETVISAMGNTEYSGHTTIPHNQWRILPLVHFEMHPKGLGLENQKMGVGRSQQTGKLGM